MRVFLLLRLLTVEFVIASRNSPGVSAWAGSSEPRRPAAEVMLFFLLSDSGKRENSCRHLVAYG